MGKSEREKGKRGERELAAELRKYGFDARRGVQYQGSPCSPDIVGMPAIHIECKRVERLNISKAMAQAIADSGPDETPTVFHRKSREGWFVTMRMTDWVEFYKEYIKGKSCE